MGDRERERAGRVSGCPQRRFLDHRGEGVYHLGFEVPDLEHAETHVRNAGVTVTASGRGADGSGFAYFDTRDDTGVTLEVRRTSEAGGTRKS